MVKRFWVIRNNKPVIDSVNKLFDFPTLYTKIPRDKLLALLNSMTEFALRDGIRDKIRALYNQAYSIKNNSKMTGNRYSQTSLRPAVKYNLENCFFKVVS